MKNCSLPNHPAPPSHPPPLPSPPLKFKRLYSLFSISGLFLSPKLDVLIQFGSEFDVISDGCLCCLSSSVSSLFCGERRRDAEPRVHRCDPRRNGIIPLKARHRRLEF